MAKKTNAGTQQASKTNGEKKKVKPARLTEKEKFEKYGYDKTPLGYKIKFKPLTEKQQEYYDLIMNKRITFGTGVAGSGKSFVCLTAALQLLKEDNPYKQILIVTPTVEAGNMELGFLPGSKEDKIASYLEADFATIQDIIEFNNNDSEYNLQRLVDSGLVKGDCINFMRGKTIKNSIVIITEAENFSKKDMWLLLSRISPTSKYIINGDNRQQDRRDIKKGDKNALQYAREKFYGKTDIVGFCNFVRKDIVRDSIIEELMDLWFDGEVFDED